jgi:hypothetical protein
MTTPETIRVKRLGTFAGGSYGFGQPGELVDLWVVDCPAYRDARSTLRVGSIQPWVYPSRSRARLAASRLRSSRH